MVKSIWKLCNIAFTIEIILISLLAILAYLSQSIILLFGIAVIFLIASIINPILIDADMYGYEQSRKEKGCSYGKI